MGKDNLQKYFILSILTHGVLLSICHTNLFNINFNEDEVIEVSLCGLGDISKDIGGVGDGEKTEPNPFEDPSRNVQESEIENDDVLDLKADKVFEDKNLPDGNNEKLLKHMEEKAMQLDDNIADENGNDKQEEIADADVEQKEYQEIIEKDAEQNLEENEATSVLVADEGIGLLEEKDDSELQNEIEEKKRLEKLAEEEKAKKEHEEKIERERKEKERKEKERKAKELQKRKEQDLKKKRKKKRKMLANLLDEDIKKEKNDKEFDKLLSGISDKDLGIRKAKKNISSSVGGQGGGHGGTDLDSSDYGMIKQQIIPHWYVPASVNMSNNMVVSLDVSIAENGAVTDVVIIDANRYNSDTLFKVAVDSARRAVFLASPLKIPSGKLKFFRKFIMKFDPRDAVH